LAHASQSENFFLFVSSFFFFGVHFAIHTFATMSTTLHETKESDRSKTAFGGGRGTKAPDAVALSAWFDALAAERLSTERWVRGQVIDDICGLMGWGRDMKDSMTDDVPTSRMTQRQVVELLVDYSPLDNSFVTAELDRAVAKLSALPKIAAPAVTDASTSISSTPAI
jgi:hypothetical protein